MHSFINSSCTNKQHVVYGCAVKTSGHPSSISNDMNMKKALGLTIASKAGNILSGAAGIASLEKGSEVTIYEKDKPKYIPYV